MSYVFVTLEIGVVFDTYKEAWNVYENHGEEFKGVYEINSTGVEGINVSGSFFDPRHDELKEMAKKVAERHINKRREEYGRS